MDVILLSVQTGSPELSPGVMTGSSSELGPHRLEGLKTSNPSAHFFVPMCPGERH